MVTVLVIVKLPVGTGGHLCPLEALECAPVMATRVPVLGAGRTWVCCSGWAALGCFLGCFSTGTHARREKGAVGSNLGLRWDWKFCLRPWNFDFLFGLALGLPPPHIRTFGSDTFSPSPSQDLFPHL